jgi:hypothetical protein
MVGLFGVVGVVAGAVGARWSKYYGSRTETLEACAGVLLVVGLGWVGSVLPRLC